MFKWMTDNPFGTLAILFFIAISVIQNFQRVSNDIATEENEVMAARTLDLSIKYDEDFCSARGHNVLIKVRNLGSEIVTGFSLKVDAKVPQFSNSVVIENESIVSDRILQPSEDWVNCFKNPSLKSGLMIKPELLDWYVVAKSVEIGDK